jgi:hypothetical protein
MSKGYFTDKATKPYDYTVIEILGTSKNNWDLLFKHLAVESKLKGKISFMA